MRPKLDRLLGSTFLTSSWTNGGARSVDRLLTQPEAIINCFHLNATQFDSMAEPQHRKLTAMAMAKLVASGRPAVLKRMSGEIFNLWLDVLGEMKEALVGEDEKYALQLATSYR